MISPKRTRNIEFVKIFYTFHKSALY